MASQWSSKTIVVLSVGLKGFQVGMPEWLGFPDLAKFIQAMLTRLASTCADSPPPVICSHKSALSKTNGISEQ